MEQVSFAELQATYSIWLEANVVPDADGKRRPNDDQVRIFLDTSILNDPGTVYVEGAIATALWSHVIDAINTQVLAETLATISGEKVRVIGMTGAGEFLVWLLTPANANVNQTAIDASGDYWSDLSAFFVQQTEGPLITITPDANSVTTYFRTEIDEIASNPEIDTINGVARADIGIDIFSSVSVARKAYLMAMFNGEFAGDILHSSYNSIQTAGGSDFFLKLDAETLAALGLGSLSLQYPSSTPALPNDLLREALENSYARGLHAALFGPVMAAHDTEFESFVGADTGSAEFVDLQNAVAGFVQKIFEADPDADVSSLIEIAKQTSVDGDGLQLLTNYFKLLTNHVQPFIDDAPEVLKRDLNQSVTEILNAAQGLIPDVPGDLQKRLAVTSGGRELYLLDQWRQEVLHPGDLLDAAIPNVGVYSKSETDLGTAVYLTLGSSSAYAIIRKSVELLIDHVSVPLGDKIRAITEHFDYFEDARQKIVSFLEKVVDSALDALGAPFRDAVFGQFEYADGKAAVQAFDSSSDIGNILQLQVGIDESTLIGNGNDNVALHFGHGNVYGLGGDDKLLGLNSDLGDDGKALKLHGGDGDDIIALAFGEGGFAYGDAGDDLLIGGGKEAHLFGGSGNDTFLIGSGTHIEDGEAGDHTYFAFVQLFGGVAPWWSDSNTAVWAPFTSLSYAFPVIGAELLALGSLLIDVATMNFARYRMTADGSLQVEVGYGLGGNALIHNYNLNLSSGRGTAGITVFKQGGGGKAAGVNGVAQYVNLALYAGFGHGLPGFDPLVLDLDGDGFEVTAREYSQVYFDFEANGFAKQTGWVGGDDALLARDLNMNGLIDDGSELFGNRGQSGFAALGTLDSNADGVIDAGDAGFASLRIWRDLNQDGVSQADELQTLSQAGISSLSLASVATPGGQLRSMVNNFVGSAGSAILPRRLRWRWARWDTVRSKVFRRATAGAVGLILAIVMSNTPAVAEQRRTNSDAPKSIVVLDTHRTLSSCRAALRRRTITCRSVRFQRGESIQSAWLDLNGDHTKDLIVRRQTREDCGSLGCLTEVFMSVRGGLRLAAPSILSDAPIYVCRSHGKTGLRLSSGDGLGRCFLFGIPS